MCKRNFLFPEEAEAEVKEIRRQVREHLEMAKENMEENLMLCIDNMLAEIREV